MRTQFLFGLSDALHACKAHQAPPWPPRTGRRMIIRVRVCLECLGLLHKLYRGAAL